MEAREAQIHLVVDGFNVAHAWGLAGGGSSRWVEKVARSLVKELEDLRDTQGWRVTLVFDGKGRDAESERVGRDDGFMILYAPASLTADAVIEQMASGSETPGLLRVATGDLAVVHAVEASGAEVLSPTALRDEVKRARRLKRLHLKKRGSSSENAFVNRIPL